MKPKTWPTSKRRELIMLYRNGKITKADVMKKLGVVGNYNTFNSIYVNCTQADFNEK